MDFSIDPKAARRIATLFRQASAAPSKLTHSASLELTAQALGLPNWDTLSGRLSPETKRRAHAHEQSLPAPVHLFMEVHQEDCESESPAWCRLTVTPVLWTLINELCEQSRACRRRVSRGLGDETCWDNSCGYLDVAEDEITVQDGMLRVRGEYRYSTGCPATTSVDISQLSKALKDRTYEGDRLKWVGNELFVSCGDVNEFIEHVADTADADLAVVADRASTL